MRDLSASQWNQFSDLAQVSGLTEDATGDAQDPFQCMGAVPW